MTSVTSKDNSIYNIYQAPVNCDNHHRSVNVPILSSNFNRNVKILTCVAGLAAVYAIYEICLKPHLNFYYAKNANIQHIKECINGYEIPGCKNGVYCANLDPTMGQRFPIGGGILSYACTNKMNADSPGLFEESKHYVNELLQEYVDSSNILQKIYDAVYDKLFLYKYN